jgi:glycosyltransferase involved in cell wall biosynthesis
MSEEAIQSGATPDGSKSASLEPPADKTTRGRVCLVTTEFHGLFKNGGIGTANTGLAFALAEAGFEVTVAFADSDENGPRVKDGNFLKLKCKYQELGITLDFVPVGRIAKAFEDPRSASYCVYLYLKQHAFDVVYFNDCGGQGYYSLLAKHAGVFRSAPRMYVVAHGPQEWVLELNSIRYWDRSPVITAYLERRSAELADALISPSHYLIDWMKSRGWLMPPAHQVIQNIVPLPAGVVARQQYRETEAIREIVFFGRLEVRKGLELFCDAIDLLERTVNLANLRITFMGKFAHIAGLHSGIYVLERARRWHTMLRILARYGQDEAIAYINSPGVVPVIPSVAENSPCVVAECLRLQLPFIATDSGGTAELVTVEDRVRCLVAPNPGAMAAKLEEILNSGHYPSRPAVSPAEIRAEWLRLTESAVRDCAGAVSNSSSASLGMALDDSASLPLVSVCLVLSSLSADTEVLVDSLLKQTYGRLEVILVDEGGPCVRPHPASSALEPARERISVRVLQARQQDRGDVRNAAAAAATGEYLLFLGEDVAILMPECVDALVKAALLTNANVLTALSLQFQFGNRPSNKGDGKPGYFPIGGCAELGAFENCFGKGAILVDRKSFERGGGFQAGCNAAIADWLFLATSVLTGLRLEVVPEPLFWYRVRQPVELNRSTSVADHRRILDAYSGYEIRLFRHIVENMLDVDRANHEALRDLMAGINAEAREIALRVSSSFEPNGDDALRDIVQFCIERHKLQEAFDFAFHNGRFLLTDAIGSAKRIAESLALDSTRQQTLDLFTDIDLGEDVKRRVKPVLPVPANTLPPSGGVAAHPIQRGLTTLRAASVGPLGTTFLRAVATVDAPAFGSVSLALVASAPGNRLPMRDEDLSSANGFWWSGWVQADKPGDVLQLAVSVKEPTSHPLDLHFLCRTSGEKIPPASNVLWTSVVATVSVNSLISTSAINLSQFTAPVPTELIHGGVLLTKSYQFPFPVFVPGQPTLVHPLPGEVVLVCIPGAVPVGAKAIRSVVSIQNAQSHPVQFATWVRTPDAPANTADDFTETDAFSGWLSVQNTFRNHDFTLVLSEPAKETMDLYLGTRVVGYPDVYFCHSVWNELLILQ